MVDYGVSANVETTCTTGTTPTTFFLTHVIVTVPLSVLKDGNIALVPALPAGIQDNVDNRAWFRGFKLLVKFDTRWLSATKVACLKSIREVMSAMMAREESKRRHPQK